MLGAYITIGILSLVLLLIITSIVYPKLKKYQLIIKKIEPKKKVRRKATKKKKSIWIKVI